MAGMPIKRAKAAWRSHLTEYEAAEVAKCEVYIELARYAAMSSLKDIRKDARKRARRAASKRK